MTNTSLTSVLLASYNYHRFLKESVESVWAQRNAVVELIVSDDGSSDGSVELLEELSKISPIRMEVIPHKNLGVVRSFNIALRAARGGFIQLLAADDRIHPDKSRLQMDALEHNPSSALCHSRYTPIDALGAELSPGDAAKWEATAFNPAQGHCLSELMLGTVSVRTGVMLRRSYLSELGGFDESYRAEDLSTILRAAKHGPICFVDQPLLDRRLHGRNWTFRFLQELPGRVAVRDAGLHLFKELAPPGLAEEAAWRMIVLCVTTSTNVGNASWGYSFLTEALRIYPKLARRVPQLAMRTLASYSWNRLARPRLSVDTAQAISKMAHSLTGLMK